MRPRHKPLYEKPVPIDVFDDGNQRKVLKMVASCGEAGMSDADMGPNVKKVLDMAGTLQRARFLPSHYATAGAHGWWN